MLKQSLTTLFLCLCFGAASCTDKAQGIANLGDPPAPPTTDENSVAAPADGTVPGKKPKKGPGNPPPEPVPEPMTMLLFGSGMAGLAYGWRRRRRQHEKQD